MARLHKEVIKNDAIPRQCCNVWKRVAASAWSGDDERMRAFKAAFTDQA
jgi:hypothetical protein